jgi:hypothetical protein
MSILNIYVKEVDKKKKFVKINVKKKKFGIIF